MSITQQNWMNANASRRYPVDDTATCTDDAGRLLPADILVDMHIRWPATLGQYAFISGITVTRSIVTVVILAASSPTAVSGFVPLASVTITQPGTEYGMYSLNPLTSGVGGFIAFGDLSEDCSLRFSSPSQSLLCDRIARPYTELPVPSVRKHGRTDGLTDIVKILGENDIEVVSDTRVIDDVLRNVIVVRLRSQTAVRNPLAVYVGPCGQRPESNTCEQVGIQTINGVMPDCDGNINIDFQSLTAVGYHNCGTQHSGVTLDQPLTLADVCPSRKAVRFLGKDYCNGGASLSLPMYGDDGTGGGEPVIPDGSSSSTSEVMCGELPFQDCFDTQIDQSWVTKVGTFQLVDSVPSEDYPCALEICPPDPDERIFGDTFTAEDDEDIWGGVFTHDPEVDIDVKVFGDVFTDDDGEDIWGGVFSGDQESGSSTGCLEAIVQSLQLADLTKRNIVIWEDCGTETSRNKKVTTQVQLLDEGSQHNAGITLNYRTVDPYTNPRVNFMVAQINKTTNQLQLVRYNGTTTITENVVTPAVPFVFDDWYEIQVSVTAIGAATLVAIDVRNVTVPDWPPISLSLLTSLWGSTDGYFGVHTLKSAANFGFWRLEDV